jgi:hypothetical protein
MSDDRWTEPPELTRRALLVGAVRWPLAAGLAAGSALLVLHPRGSPEADCMRPLLCGDCAKFAGCGLPRAQEARRQQGAVDA